MQSALRITTKVLPGNKIEVQLPPGSEGEEVDVFIVLPEKPQAERRNVMEIIEKARKRHAGKLLKILIGKFGLKEIHGTANYPTFRHRLRRHLYFLVVVLCQVLTS